LVEVVSNNSHGLCTHDSVAVVAMELGVIWLLNWTNLCDIGSSLAKFSVDGQQLCYMTYEIVAVDIFCLVVRVAQGKNGDYKTEAVAARSRRVYAVAAVEIGMMQRHSRKCGR